jgi:hypothetical protein
MRSRYSNIPTVNIDYGFSKNEMSLEASGYESNLDYCPCLYFNSAVSRPFLNAVVGGGEFTLLSPRDVRNALSYFLTFQTTSPCNMMGSVFII